MEIKKEIENIKKDKLFNIYSKIIENFKDYKNITKQEILNEILFIYSDYKNIIDLCTYNQLEYLKKIIYKKNIDLNIEIEEELKLNLLLFYEGEKRVIPKEFLPTIKKAIKKVKKEEKIAIDELNDLIIGLVKIYGIASIEIISNKINSITNITKEKIINLIENNKFLKKYMYKIFYDDKGYYMFEPYFSFEEDLVYTLEVFKELEYADVKIEDLIIHRYNMFDIRNSIIKEFLDKIYSYGFDPAELFYKILKCATLDNDRDAIIKYMLNIKELKNEKEEDLRKLIDKAMNEMPSATLKGHTPNEIMQKQLQEEYDKQYQKTFNYTKNDEAIQDYKCIREEIEDIFYECSLYLTKHYNDKLQELFHLLKENNIEISAEESNIINNFLLYHTKENEQKLFSLYVNQAINVLSNKYKLAWQAEENYVESLFQVKKLNPTKGTVELYDLKSKKKYMIYDLAFSCGNKNMEGSYLYTTLLTINKFTFANGYAFIFIKDFHKNIEEELEDLKKVIVGTENEQTKEFMACYKLFKNENILFSARPLK